MAKNKLSGTTLKVGGFLEEFEKDSIKDNVNIVELFSSYGIKLTKKGNSYMGCCPWHDDKTPSLSVDKAKGLYNCFGCGESGDAFSLVMKMEGVDFKDSVSIIKEKHITPLEINKNETYETRKGGIETPTNSLDVVKDILNDPRRDKYLDLVMVKVRDFYFTELQVNIEAKKYLIERGLNDNSLIRQHNIGYCSGNLKGKLSDDQVDFLKEVGLLNDKGKEVFEGYLVFPLTNEDHDTVGFYGRSIDDNSKVKHKYLKGEHRGLLNYKAVGIYSDEIILTESVIDALSLKKLGFNNTIPCYGVNGFSAPHLKAFKDNRVKKVVIAFDSDEAGINGSKNLIDKLFNEGFEVKEIIPPKGKDWNEYLLNGGSEEELRGLIDSITYESKNKSPFEVETSDGKHIYTFGDMVYRVSGVKETFISNLRVNIKAEIEGKSDIDYENPSIVPRGTVSKSKSYIDNVDLYSARSRTAFIGRLASSLDINSATIEKQILTIIEHLEELRDRALVDDETNPEIILTEEDKKLGLSFLKNPNMFEEIVKDTEILGYVGEAINKQLIYLAASSRLLDDPISVTVISESASGKSYLIDTIKKLIPEEDVLSITTLSDQALNYLPEDALINKFMVMGEAVHSDIIDHQIREMLSSKELSRLVTTKDDKTGKMVSKTVRKDVVVSTVMSSTQTDINPENASRVFVINTDESVEQTRRIHSKQREKYSLNRYKSKAQDIPQIIQKHKSAQRMLKNILIVNDFVEHLTFPDSLMRTRRDHERFIDLISTVCFLRQYQKEIKTEFIDNEEVDYISCDLEDYKIAREIMVSILSATMVNLPKGALTLYQDIRDIAKKESNIQGIAPEEVVFTQRDIRERTGSSQMFVKRNLKHLVDYEYIKKVTGINGKRNTYKLHKDEHIELVDNTVIPGVDVMEGIING